MLFIAWTLLILFGLLILNMLDIGVEYFRFTHYLIFMVSAIIIALSLACIFGGLFRDLLH